jgi:hypothetical protein
VDYVGWYALCTSDDHAEAVSATSARLRRAWRGRRFAKRNLEAGRSRIGKAQGGEDEERRDVRRVSALTCLRCRTTDERNYREER